VPTKSKHRGSIQKSKHMCVQGIHSSTAMSRTNAFLCDIISSLQSVVILLQWLLYSFNLFKICNSSIYSVIIYTRFLLVHYLLKCAQHLDRTPTIKRRYNDLEIDDN
jgi:hypothetical protein